MNDKMTVEFIEFVAFPHPNGGKDPVLKRVLTIEDHNTVWFLDNVVRFENEDGSFLLVPYSNIKYLSAPADWLVHGGGQ